MNEIKPLPCPFCGGESAVNTVRYSNAHVIEQGWKQHEFYGVNCILCGADNRGLVGYETPEKAIETWNNRVPHIPEAVTAKDAPNADGGIEDDIWAEGFNACREKMLEAAQEEKP